ncbi:hypothetical protein EV702DRAFT_1123674 [Suillus placidus]|uniref:Uncharacterized protein n=1 Tax=Suillus placidus TaxID=48579 RepID=A0A9P6ZQ65_9AGAM|nr:hypothetical protein EV702DRAFT_1123674 [Suillus placidus]
MEDGTGINVQALGASQPGMTNARERLQWVSTHVTAVPEDIMDSLSRIFGVYVPAIHGENPQRALGRLLQEIVAESGDIAPLDWVGRSSEFNSCLPADVASYAAPPRVPLSLSEDEIQIAVSSLQNIVAPGLALRLHARLENMSPARFEHRRLHLPCTVFPVTAVRRQRGPAQETPRMYDVKADELHDLLITSEQALIQFSRARPTRQTFLLVRPLDSRLLELPDFANDAESLGDWSEPESPLYHSHGGYPVKEEPADSESLSRALRLIVRLGQPFSAILLARQRSGVYKRIASDHDIIVQVKDMASVHTMMDIRTLEIL